MTQTVLIHTTPTSYRVQVTLSGHLVGTNVSINEFCSPFIEQEYDRRNYKWIVTKKYRHYDKATQTLYLPRYDLDRFISFLSMSGLNWKIHDVPLVIGAPVSIPMKPWFTPKDELQANAINYLINDPSPVRGLALQTGRGKGQPLHAQIKIPGGWKSMGQIQVGDRVISRDGSATSVVGVYPNGIMPLYRVTFEDGRQVEVDDTHLWQTFYADQSCYSHWQIRNTLEMKRLCEENSDIYIPLCEPEKCPDKTVPMEPYLLGYVLGNGQIENPGIGFSASDVLTIERIRSVLDGKTFVPEVYFSSSPQQKQALLQGLMDASGYVSCSGVISFIHPNSDLVANVIELVRSLGGIAIKSFSDQKIDIRIATPENLFRCFHKKSLVPNTDPYAPELKLRVIAVDYIGEVATQCIAVDHPEHLYITDNYVVTHNTASLIAALSGIGRRSMILVPSMIEQWTKAILNFTELAEDDIFIVQGMPSLAKLLKRIDKSLFPKIILVSIPTLRSYLDGSESYVNFPPFTELCTRLRVGVVGKDETHLLFHANLLLDMTLNPAVIIPMTATFETGSANIVEIFDAHYPKRIRFGEEDYESYVDIFGYGYRIDRHKLPKSLFKGMRGYSQVKFEYWLLTKGRPVLEQIMATVVQPILNIHYINVAKPGERLLILCAMVEMCDYFIDYIKETYPEKSVTIYVGETDDSVLNTHDIIVSTPKSAGTGRDIPGLLTTYVFVSARSSPLNKQMLGRLRKLRDRTPMFAYSHCLDIPSHVDHAKEREFLFTPLAKTIQHYVL